MDLHNEDREARIRQIPKFVGFKAPTKQVECADRRLEATAQRRPPDLTCLLSGSRRPGALADNMRDGEKGGGRKSRKRENKGIKPKNVSEVIEARTMRRRGNGVCECVQDVIRADVCSPRVSFRGYSV